MSDMSRSQKVQHWIERLRAGDDRAKQELLASVCERMTELAHQMLKDYPRVHRWEDTADVVQNALIRLSRTLEEVRPETEADFYRLASLNIRRELLDLSRHYYGPHGVGAHHHTMAGHEERDGAAVVLEPAESGEEAGRLALWTEFHRQVEVLPTEEREVFELLWYQGLQQSEAAAVLGVAESTIKRRWRRARVLLHEALGGDLPG